MSHELVVILGQMHQGVGGAVQARCGVGEVPNPSGAQFSARQGLSSCFTLRLEQLYTQIGACDSEQIETYELPPLAPRGLHRALCSGSQGFQRSPQLGGLEQQISQQSWLPQQKASCNICEDS